MTPQRKPHRVYEFTGPKPMRVEIHDRDCPCCNPPADRPLSFVDLGRLAMLGAAVGSAIAFAIDHVGAAQALLSVVGIYR